MNGKSAFMPVLVAFAVLVAIGCLLSAPNVQAAAGESVAKEIPSVLTVSLPTSTVVANATASIEAATNPTPIANSPIIPLASLHASGDPNSEPISSATYEIVINKTDPDFIEDYSTPQKAIITIYQALYRGDRDVYYNSMDRESVQIYNDVLKHGNRTFEDAVKIYSVCDKTILLGEVVYDDVTFVKFKAINPQNPDRPLCCVDACIREDGEWKKTLIYGADKRLHKLQNELMEFVMPGIMKRHNAEIKRKFKEAMKKQKEQQQQENNR